MANTRTNTNQSGGFLDDLLLNGQIAWKLYTDPRVSMLLKVAVPVIALLYFIMPIDLLPDFIPVLGQLDEVAIALLLIRMFVALAPTDETPVPCGVPFNPPIKVKAVCELLQ